MAYSIQMYSINHMYHNTSYENRHKIKVEKRLGGNSYMGMVEGVMKEIDGTPNRSGIAGVYENPIRENNPVRKKVKSYYNGTWFCCSRFNGLLPTTATFGPVRFVVSLQSIMGMFEQPQLYDFREYDVPSNRGGELHHTSHYIELILSEGKIPGLKAKKVPLENKYITLQKPFCVSSEWYTWVNVFVMKELDLNIVKYGITDCNTQIPNITFYN